MWGTVSSAGIDCLSPSLFRPFPLSRAIFLLSCHLDIHRCSLLFPLSFRITAYFFSLFFLWCLLKNRWFLAKRFLNRALLMRRCRSGSILLRRLMMSERSSANLVWVIRIVFSLRTTGEGLPITRREFGWWWSRN